jgi:hypothetical protein
MVKDLFVAAFGHRDVMGQERDSLSDMTAQVLTGVKERMLHYSMVLARECREWAAFVGSRSSNHFPP